MAPTANLQLPHTLNTEMRGGDDKYDGSVDVLAANVPLLWHVPVVYRCSAPNVAILVPFLATYDTGACMTP